MKLRKRYHYSWVVLKELVKTDFQLRYQGSFLGVAWSVLQPLLLFVVMYTVFVRFLKFTDGTPNFPIVLLLGISLWNFFNEAASMGMYSVVNRGDLLRKIHFPGYIVTVSATIGSLISLGINLLVVIVFSLFARVQFTWRVLLVPFNLLQLYILALGVALVLSTMFVFFRDIGHIWEVFSQALFYAVPIIYPLSMVTAINPVYSKIILMNPIAQAIQDIRNNLLAPTTTPTTWNMVNNPFLQIIPVVLTVVIFLLGLHLFRKHNRRFAEVL